MPGEPVVKRAVAFFDGQNLFHAAKRAFGETYPSYDPLVLAQTVCASQGWVLGQTRFYTGIPRAADNAKWHAFWTKKLAVMGTRKVVTFSRSLRYRDQAILLADGTATTAKVGQEKGIDVRIALDVVQLALDGSYDVALIFSQDQDLSEAVREVKNVSRVLGRWLSVACAFPVSPTYTNSRGINGAQWLPINAAQYTACVDPIDYRR